jgi:hypothetical protein
MKRIIMGLLAVATAVITHIAVYFIIMYYPLSAVGALLIASIYPIGMMTALYLADEFVHTGKL